MPKSLLDRNDEEGFIPSYRPNIVREIKIEIPGYDRQVNVQVDLQETDPPSQARAEILIGLTTIRLDGAFLLEPEDKLVAHLMSSEWYRAKIEEAIENWKWVDESPSLHKEWVETNLPWSSGQIRIVGEVCNAREIRLQVWRNDNWLEGVSCIYSPVDAEICLNALKGGLSVRILTDYERLHISKKELVDPTKSSSVAWEFQKEKPKTRAFVKRIF